jgi:outer membrane protein
MRYLLLLLAPAVAIAQTGGAPTARPVTLSEAIRLAQQNSPQTVVARNAIDQRESAVRTAWGQFLPSLTVSTGGSRSQGTTLNNQGELVSFTRPWNFSRGLSSQITVFDGGLRNYNLSAAKSEVAAANADERGARYSVALSVSQSYFAVLAARESRSAATAQLEEARQNLRSAEARLAAGAATRSDSLRSAIAVGNAQLALLTAETNLQNGNASLTRLLGTSFVVTASEADTAQVPDFSPDSAALLAALSQTPEVVAAELSVSAARSSLKASRTSYYPQLSMNFGLSGANTPDNFDPIQGHFLQSRNMSFSFSLNLFNRFAREGNIVNARIAEQNALATLRDTRLSAQQQLTQFLGDLRLARARVQIQQASVEAAQEDLRVQQQRYGLGATTLLELLTSQTALNSARIALIAARRDARIAEANIEALLGRDLR